MRVLNWKTGAVGAYLDPANWVEGVAPGPGDIAIITDPSGPSFYPAGVNPQLLSSFGQAAPPGDAIAGQTIDFTPSMASTTTPFVGEKIEASGIRYCPDENVRLTIGGQFVGDAHTNGAGKFDPQVTVPGPAGDKLLCGVGASGLPHDQDCLTLHVRAAGPNSGPPLSFTGVEIGAIIAVALALLVGGVLFATAGRRRTGKSRA